MRKILIDYKLVLTLPNIMLSLGAIKPTAGIIAALISRAIKPYSMAVAPTLVIYKCSNFTHTLHTDLREPHLGAVPHTHVKIQGLALSRGKKTPEFRFL